MGLNPPLRFGTDGWRGIIAQEFTFERLAMVVPLAAAALERQFAGYPTRSGGRRSGIVVGYDRRFLAEEFARFTADLLAEYGFEVLLAREFAPTPAFSWAAFSRGAIGALVITASHNPGIYSGLKLKGAFGGSVGREFTGDLEVAVNRGDRLEKRRGGCVTSFDPWAEYCEVLRSKVNLSLICEQVRNQELAVFTDVMHGAAAGGLARLLPGVEVIELNAGQDVLFGGVAPEPIGQNLLQIGAVISQDQVLPACCQRVGFAFDGDGDRVGALDGQGNFHSSQGLIPILIQHFCRHLGRTGEVIKTVSGSDLIERVARFYGLPLYETAVGYKYIADRMLAQPGVLLGGEESGGIGYGNHIPERDALLSALYVLEAIATSRQDLGKVYRDLQVEVGFSSSYDRIDRHLPDQATQDRLIETLGRQPFHKISDRPVIEINAIDGFKYRLEDGSWLMVRFSGTEPVLRLYCEAADSEQVGQILGWIGGWVEQFLAAEA